MITRRDSLKRAGVGLAGTLIQPYLFMSCENKVNRTKDISVQLYTIREEIEKNINQALKQLSAIGFKKVETAFWPAGISLDQAAGLLKDYDFTVSSCHIEIPIGESKSKLLEHAKAFGCEKMIWHGWPEDKRYSSLEGTLELAKIYNQASKFANDHGLVFGLHNHWWEFHNDIGGTTPFEVLNNELNESVFFELDTYWIKVAGLDPASEIRKFGKRTKFLHIKDGPARWHDSLAEDNPDPMTAVGEGTQNMNTILEVAAELKCEMVVEMDKVEGNVFQKLAESWRFLEAKV